MNVPVIPIEKNCRNDLFVLLEIAKKFLHLKRDKHTLSVGERESEYSLSAKSSSNTTNRHNVALVDA